MADYTDTKVSQLVINNLTQEKFEELKAAGKLQEDQIYLTPDTIEQRLSGKQDKATALNYDDISNCILEIPQDIKLELTDGTLTLKAGSKVFVPNGFTEAEETVQYYCWGPAKGNYVYTKSATPSVGDMMYFNENGTMVETSGQISAGNIAYTDGTSIGNDNGYTYPRYSAGDTQVTTAAGTPKFDEITIESDLSQSATGNGSYALFYKPDNQDIPYLYTSSLYSGTTNPAQTYCAWYDTSNNIVKIFTDSATVPAYTTSLPIAIFQVSNGQIASIDQVFNGFGYIGSTVFALPGVKGLIPDGRNADGSLKNLQWSTDNVRTDTMASYMASRTDNPVFVVSASGSLYAQAVNSSAFYEVDKYSDIDRSIKYAAWFVREDNRWYFVATDDVPVNKQTCLVGTCGIDANLKITRLDIKLPFRAVDYSDAEYIANQAMPSDRYIDFTVGAHGTYYRAPADGEFCILITSAPQDSIGRNIGLRDETTSRINQTYIVNANATYGVSLRVSKGSKVQGYYYGHDTSSLTIRFVYNNGAK